MQTLFKGLLYGHDAEDPFARDVREEVEAMHHATRFERLERHRARMQTRG